MAVRRFSLRSVLIAAFVLQTCTIAGAVAVISLRSNRQNVTALANQLQTEVSGRVAQHLNQYLRSPHTVNALTQDAIDRGLIEPRNFHQMKEFWLNQMADSPVGYIGFSTLEGEFVGVERLDNGEQQFNLIRKPKLNELYIFTESGQAVGRQRYTPHAEPWYQQGLRAGKAVWSDIYAWNDEPDVYAIAAAQPLYDRRGKLVGVIGTDLILTQINQYLQALQLTANSRVFIVERSGWLVASSAPHPPLQQVAGKTQRLKAVDISDPLIQRASRLLQSADIPVNGSLSLEDSEGDNLLQIYNYRDQWGLDWLVVIALPASDLMAGVYENTKWTVIFWGIAVAIALGIGWLIARVLAQPLYRLNEDAQHLALDPEFAHGGWEIDRGTESSWILELSGLAQSFREMAERWQEIVDNLHRQAYFDGVTGIGNHNLLRKRIQECITQKQEFVLLYLDLDRFKSLQYAFGHQTSATLLLEIAKRLTACTSPKDTLARIGSDEFAILFCDLGDRQAVAHKAEEIHRRIDAPMSINGSVISSTISIGVVSSQLGGTNPDTYLDAADTAMHYAKMWGKGRTVFYNAGMQTLVAERVQLESDLKTAIATSQLHLNYQPIINLRTGKVESFEALVRWYHPRRGMMPPTKFITIAEETGLIIQLGRWVMQTACAQIQKLHYHLPDQPLPSIGVNVSEVQLRYPRLLAEIDELIATIPHHTLKLEITETCLMENTEMIQSLLEDLKGRGIRLLIDDFGTGYSSLSYLQRLPVDTLKIDRSFITGIETNSRHLDITRAIITLAHSLGMDVVAEGVETMAQLEILQNLGCEYGQGYLFAQPLAPEAVIPFLGDYPASSFGMM